MDQWAEIRRRVLVDGESKRSIQRQYQLRWKTLQKILNQPEPPGYQAIKPRAKKKLGPFLPVIESILRQDRLAPPKQVQGLAPGSPAPTNAPFPMKAVAMVTCPGGIPP